MVHLPELGKRQEQGCESDMMGKYTRCGSFQGWQLSWWGLVGKCEISRRVGNWLMVDFGGLLLCWPCVLCSSKSGKIEYLLIQWELSYAVRRWPRVNWASESESELIMMVCWVLWNWWLKNRVTTACLEVKLLYLLIINISSYISLWLRLLSLSWFCL